MLVDKKTFFDPDESIGFYECVFDSSNVLKTTYFPKQNRLYIAFKRGHTYSYSNITHKIYHEFENAKSQGDFFNEKIKTKPQLYVYRKEFTLYPDEVKELNEIVDNKPKEKQDNKTITTDNEIIFYIGDQEVIKIDKDGFYWKGEMVEVDMEIYDKFVEWLDYVHNNMKQ
ncbi:MAG: KTSC domain-containing protein [bacterium]